MRHDFARGFRIARNGIEFDVDARRDHQAVIGQTRAARELDGFLVLVDGCCRLTCDLEIVFRQRVVGMGDRLKGAKIAEIKVGMKAGDEFARRFDQRHLDRAGGILGDVFCSGRAAGTAADHDDFRFGLRECRIGQGAGGGECAGGFQEFSAVG
jgi:hypothetical protein